MDVSVFKVAASGATSGGNDPPPIRDRHAPIRQSPVKGNVRRRFIIPCRVSREPTFSSVHGISFSPRFSPITFSSLFFMPRSAVWKSVVSSKDSYGAHAAARSGRGAVCRKIFLFPCGRAYFPTKSCSSYPRHLLMLPKQIPSIPAPLRHKKKSKVMRNEEKNKWKQKSSNLPLGIKAKVGLAVKVGAVALGFHVWGIDFIWVVLGFTFCYDILRGIFSCLVSLVALIGFFYFLFTHIF